MAYGVLSLVPPLVAIVLAVVTRRAIPALFLGVWSGGVIVTGGLGIDKTFEWIVLAVGASDFHAKILVFTLLLGGGVTLMWELGGSQAIRIAATRRLDSKRSAGVVAWLLGLVLFFDDYANAAILGSTMGDVADEFGMSREKLAYIVDSTAAPVATFGISSWIAFQLSMIQAGYDAAGVTDVAPTPFVTFLHSIPYNVYCIFAVLMVGVVVLSGRDYGEMLDAERRAEADRVPAEPESAEDLPVFVEEELGEEPDVPTPRLHTFVLPIVALVGVTLFGAWVTGQGGGPGVLDVVGAADWAIALVYGSFAMVATGIVLGRLHGTLSVGEAVDTTVEGFGVMLTAVTVLVLAWALAGAVESLETGAFVADATAGLIGGPTLALVVALTAAAMAFATGTSWGTMAVVTPIAVPVAWPLGGAHAVSVAVGAVFSGAIFGDHTSPISDTTVLSATFSGVDVIAHFRTQLYYAATAGFAAAVTYTLYGFLNVGPVVFLPVGFAVMLALVYVCSTWAENRRAA